MSSGFIFNAVLALFATLFPLWHLRRLYAWRGTSNAAPVRTVIAVLLIALVFGTIFIAQTWWGYVRVMGSPPDMLDHGFVHVLKAGEAAVKILAIWLYASQIKPTVTTVALVATAALIALLLS